MDETENVTDIQPNYSTYVPEFVNSSTGSGTVSPLLNTSTTPLLNSTFRNVTHGHGSSTPTSVSLALIPLFVVSIILVVLCIQCCKWFRRYSRGDKSDKAFYEIVDPDDDPLSGVEMSPDSAYASYCSASRRHHSDEDDYLQVDTINIQTPGTTDSVINREISHRKGEPIDETITPLTKTNAKENNNRKSSSSSSSQTTMTTCSESEPGNSSENSRKLNKFKVSFVKGHVHESEAHFLKLNKNRTDSGQTNSNHSSRNRSSDVQRTCVECVFCAERQTSILLKDVATQTNKSFIYSLKFPKHCRSADKHRVDSNSIDNSRIHKGKRSMSKNGLSNRDTQTNLNNNNKEVKICNGDICDVIDKDLTVIHVTCSKSPTETEKQTEQINNELTTNC